MTARLDAVGNVVGRYSGTTADAPALLLGSHYDTVRNGGRYDGRLGIFAPIAACASCTRRPAPAVRPRGGGVRRGGRPALQGDASSARGALAGKFDPALARPARRRRRDDARGDAARSAATRRASRRRAAPPAALSASSRCTSSRARCWTRTCRSASSPSINGSGRFAGEVAGMASHAGTTPMDRRRDAPRPSPSWSLYVERAPRGDAGPGRHGGHARGADGAINVVPGRCQLHARHPRDHRRACATTRVADVLRRDLPRSAQRRGVTRPARGDDARGRGACAPRWQPRWARGRRAPACRCTACRAAPATTRWHGELMPQGDAVRARQAPASATTRSRSITADDADSRSRRPRCDFLRHFQPQPHRGHPMPHDRRHPTPGSTPSFDAQARFLGDWCGCRPTRRPATTRRTPSARPSCSRAWASTVERHPVPADEVARQRHGQRRPTWSCAAASARRPDDRPERARRRGAARRRLDPRPLRRPRSSTAGCTAAAPRSPSSDFATYTFALRALEALGAALARRGRAALHLRRGIRRRDRPGLAAAAGHQPSPTC